MMCELYNKIRKYLGDIAGGYLPKESEVSLLMFVFVLAIAIFFTITLAWWILPLKRIKFRCSK